MDAVAQLNAALAGRYDIDREIGAGGMATVYLARDLKHNRKVALKVLRSDLGAVLGVERFLSEIEVTANLQHPNLLPLFDSGEAGGLLFYVMPFVDGESLRARLEREKQLPIDEAVHIATSVASALDYAHRHGVIHRDLKPENILLHEGQPLVADFGIALAVSNAGGGRITQTGLSLGTPQYMSPEQATGDRVINARTDIYSLGAVTYEMLTGDPPHVGSSSQAIIAQLLTETPRSIRVTRPNVAEHVEGAVMHALEKLPADRFGTAQEFADALTGKVIVRSSANAAAAAGSVAAYGARAITQREVWRHPTTRMLAAALAIALVVGAVREWIVAHRDRARTPVRVALTFEDSVTWADATGSPFALSPDGTVLAFIGNRNNAGRHALYVRPLGDLRARKLPGTDGASQPFFSPDGKWVGFYTTNQLRKVLVDGGSPVLLAEVPGMQGASWGSDDQIVVATRGRLATVPATGGALQIISSPDTVAGERAQRWPLALSDGASVLYTSVIGRTDDIDSARIATVSTKGTGVHELDLAGAHALAVLDGRLVYTSAEGAIMAVPFNTRTRRPSGTPVPVIDSASVGWDGLKGAVARGGSVVYTLRRPAVNQVMIGAAHSAAKPLIPDWRAHAFPRYSPDGKHLAVAIGAEKRTDVWIFDLPSGPLRRLTVEGTLNDRPEWTPDSRNVLFRSNRDGRMAIFAQPVDGHRAAERFFALPDAAVDEAVLSPKGDYLLVQLQGGGRGGGDTKVFYRAVRGDTAVKLIAGADRGQQVHPRLSPDGRWVAYSSSELGSWEVYVKPFPSLDARHQVSLNGGWQPLWSPDGRRLFYISGERLLSATMTFVPFAVVSRDTLVEGVTGGPSIGGLNAGYHPNYDIAPDGKSFVFPRTPATTSQLILVHDWKYELRARMNAAKR
jgi:serine/threonine-protein kinase